MKLKNAKNEIFDAPTSTGKALIAAGLATEVLPPPVPKRPPNSTWAVLRTPVLSFDGVNSFPCSIVVHCSTCDGRAQFAGKTCHRTQTFRHCGISESVPFEIAREYEKALDAPRAAEDAKIDRRREQPRPVAINW